MFPRVPFGGGATVLTGVTSQRETNLVLVDGPVTARSYLRDVTEPSFIQFHQQPPNSLIMDDAPPHRAKIFTA